MGGQAKTLLSYREPNFERTEPNTLELSRQRTTRIPKGTYFAWTRCPNRLEDTISTLSLSGRLRPLRARSRGTPS